MLLVSGAISAAGQVVLTGNWCTNSLTWVSGGSHPWVVQTNFTFDGGDALESSSVAAGNTGYVETQAAGQVVSFWWKVSSKPSSGLLFLTNGTIATTLSGEVDWEERRFLLPAGTNTLRWRYDTYSIGGQNKGWVDRVSINPLAEPIVITQPRSQSVYSGAYVVLAPLVASALPMTYQWRFNDADLVNATNATLTLTNFGPAAAGSYRLHASNALGTVETSNALLSPASLPKANAMTPLWRIAAGAKPWLPIDSNLPYRGLAYNPATDRVLVASRAGGTNIWVLNGSTGEALYTLNLGTVVTGGTFVLNAIGVADDGAVYAGNLTQESRTNAFRLYRWANDDSNAVPELAWSGDPTGGAGPYRWGDTMDVRGAGADTEILLGANSSRSVALLYPGRPTNSAVRLLIPGSLVSGVAAVCFGPAQTFWINWLPGDLRYVSYTNQTTAILRTYPAFPFYLAGLAVNPSEQTLACIAAHNPDQLRLYSLSALTNDPVWLDTKFIVHPMDATNAYYVGAVDLGPGRIYALDGNNGIVAMKVAPPLAITQGTEGLLLSWPRGELQSTPSIEDPFENVPGATSPHPLSLEAPAQFFRVLY